jgi:hypothetical protein
VSVHYNVITSKGWCDLILDDTQSEEKAVDKFYELLDEYVETPKEEIENKYNDLLQRNTNYFGRKNKYNS